MMCCRLNQAEKVAGKFVAKRIRPALQRAREKELPELLSESRDYLKGLWSRLNGTAGRSRKVLPAELKLPGGSQKEVDKVGPSSWLWGWVVDVKASGPRHSRPLGARANFIVSLFGVCGA